MSKTISCQNKGYSRLQFQAQIDTKSKLLFFANDENFVSNDRLTNCMIIKTLCRANELFEAAKNDFLFKLKMALQEVLPQTFFCPWTLELKGSSCIFSLCWHDKKSLGENWMDEIMELKTMKHFNLWLGYPRLPWKWIEVVKTRISFDFVA